MAAGVQREGLSLPSRRRPAAEDPGWAAPAFAQPEHPRGAAQRRKLQALFGPRPVQRYVDVMDDSQFAQANTAAFDDHWVERKRYSWIQQFLSDISRTQPALDALNRELMQQPQQSLSQLLRVHETSRGAGFLQAVEGVPAPDFRAIVAQGIRFEDWVEQGHGVQTHRIQWYLIEKQFGSSVTELYSMATNPIFALASIGGKSIWDLVVDSVHKNDNHDFTHPATLQNYLLSRYVPGANRLMRLINRLRRPARLRTELARGDESFFQDRQRLQDARPVRNQAVAPAAPVADAEGHLWSGWKQSGQQGGLPVWNPTLRGPAP